MTPREPRRPVFIKARMRVGAGWCDVLIQNMSSRGLMARARGAFPRGAILEIRRAQHIIVGDVRWSGDGRFGLRTKDPIDIDAVVRADSEARAAAAQGPEVERRLRQRPRHDEQAERSRMFGNQFQFVAMVLVGIPAALFAGSAVFHLLDAPAHAIVLALSGR